MTYDAATLLASVRQRSRRPGKGVGLASDYVASLASCFGSPTCSTRMASLLAGDWQKALKDSEQKLVYRNARMKVVKETINTSTASIAPGYLLEFDSISTNADKDRDGDVLECTGATVDPLGPLLWQHIPLQPIGRHLRLVSNDGTRLLERNGIIDLKNPLTDDAALLVEAGALRISIGFDPQEFEPLKGPNGQTGWHVLRFEILERSLVSIPANAGAIITAFSRGKLHDPVIKSWAESLYHSRPAQVRGGYAPSAKAVVGLPDVRQKETFSCGCASLRAVAKFYEVGPESEDDFAKLLGTTDKDGTDFHALLKVGKDELGLQVQDFHGDTEGKELDSWLAKGWPVICAVQQGGTPESQAANKEGHYVTAMDSDPDSIRYQDPVDGRHKEDRKSFLARWHDVDADGKEYVCCGIAFGPPIKTASRHAGSRKKHRCTCGSKASGSDDEDELICPYCGSDEVICDGEDMDADCICENCGNSFDREDAEEGKNMAATVTKDKQADKDRAWDADAAIKRLRKWAGVDADKPAAAAWKKYGQGFAWSASDASKVGDFKLPFKDIIDDKLTTIWKGAVAAAAAVQGSRGGVDIPSADLPAVKKKLEAAYHEFDEKAPWEDDGKSRHVLVKSLMPAATKKYGPWIGIPYFEGSYEYISDELEDSIEKKLGEALDLDDYDQCCIIATFPDRAVFAVIEGCSSYSYGGYYLGDGDYDSDDGYSYYQHPYSMQDGKPVWADGDPAEVELTAAVRETAKGIVAMKLKSGRAISEKNMKALKDAHGLFQETKGLSDLIADHKSACEEGMKHLKEVMDGNDGGGSEPAGDSVTGDYATSGEGGKPSDYGKHGRIVTIKRVPAYAADGKVLGVKETITVIKAGSVLSKANAEKCVKAYQKAEEMADHEKMPRSGKSMMRECKSILKEVITGAGYDVVGKEDSTDPSGKPNAGADGEPNPMDGDGKGMDALSSKVLGGLLAGKAPSPGVLASLKEAVDEAAAKLPDVMLGHALESTATVAPKAT